MAAWQLQEAKARFSEFLDAALEKGPQIVTRRGVEAAVLVPIGEWRRLQQAARPGVKELLLEKTPLFDDLVPERRKLSRREPVEFE
jgi:antitoxin Phd